MGKKYEPVPDEKRQELIDLIYNKGMNISKAAQVAKIYYPTAKAINKIFVKTNRICKKVNRNRIGKNVQIKVNQNETDSVMNRQEQTYDDGSLFPNFGVQETHASTHCETTRNESSVHLSPKRESALQLKVSQQDLLTEELTNVLPTKQEVKDCPFHTPERSQQLHDVLKLVRNLHAKSCESCRSLFACNHSNEKKQLIRQNTPHFGAMEQFAEEAMQEQVETIDLFTDQPVFQFKQYTKMTIHRPIAIYRNPEIQESYLENLLNDPVVQGYIDLPMAGCKKEENEK